MAVSARLSAWCGRVRTAWQLTRGSFALGLLGLVAMGVLTRDGVAVLDLGVLRHGGCSAVIRDVEVGGGSQSTVADGCCGCGGPNV
jgi:hypothetical protein